MEENQPPRSPLLRGCSEISHMVERLLLLKRSAVLKTLKTMRIVKFSFDKATSSKPKTYYHKEMFAIAIFALYFLSDSVTVFICIESEHESISC